MDWDMSNFTKHHKNFVNISISLQWFTFKNKSSISVLIIYERLNSCQGTQYNWRPQHTTILLVIIDAMGKYEPHWLILYRRCNYNSNNNTQSHWQTLISICVLYWVNWTDTKMPFNTQCWVSFFFRINFWLNCSIRTSHHNTFK